MTSKYSTPLSIAALSVLSASAKMDVITVHTMGKYMTTKEARSMWMTGFGILTEAHTRCARCWLPTKRAIYLTLTC